MESAVPPGVPFGEYRLLKRLGAGGMAEVFLAKRIGPAGFEKQLVIKRILPHLTKSERFTQMFLREARLAAVVDHPSLVHVSSFGEIGGNYYLAMEFVDGITVADFMAIVGALSPGVACRIAVDLCGALQAIHTAKNESGAPLGLVHRDVSPRNVMLTREGAVKLLDFGIAISNEETIETMLVGTRRHMSPEQMLSKDLDGRSDLFCLGVLLYQMISGDVPFLEGVPSKLPDRPDSIPIELWATIEKALAIEPADRPTAARLLQSPLELYVASRGIEGTRAHLAELVSEVLAPSSSVPRAISRLKTGIKRLTAPLTADVGEPVSAASSEIAHDVTSAPLPNDLTTGEPPPRTWAWTTGGVVAIALVGVGIVALLPKPEPEEAPPPKQAVVTATVAETPKLVVPPQPEPEPATVVKARSPGPGTLTIDTRPWTEVWVGGRKLGLTPMEGVKLPSGVHELELKNPSLGMTRKIKVTIRPGKVTRVQRDL